MEGGVALKTFSAAIYDEVVLDSLFAADAESGRARGIEGDQCSPALAGAL